MQNPYVVHKYIINSIDKVAACFKWRVDGYAEGHMLLTSYPKDVLGIAEGGSLESQL
jgi:hypothetical protein